MNKKISLILLITALFFISCSEKTNSCDKVISDYQKTVNSYIQLAKECKEKPGDEALKNKTSDARKVMDEFKNKNEYSSCSKDTSFVNSINEIDNKVLKEFDLQ